MKLVRGVVVFGPGEDPGSMNAIPEVAHTANGTWFMGAPPRTLYMASVKPIYLDSELVAVEFDIQPLEDHPESYFVDSADWSHFIG